jgi:hypothetical protein
MKPKLWHSIRRAAAASWPQRLPSWLSGPAVGIAALATGVVGGLAALGVLAYLSAPARADSLPHRAKLGAVAAEAQPAPAWQGPWIGAHLGLAAVATDIDGLASLAGDGLEAGLAAGYNIRSGNLVGGVWGEYTFADVQTSFAGERVTKGAWAAGVLGGVLINPRLLAFGTVGWTTVEASASFAALPDFTGLVYGGGLEALLPGDAFGFKLEYRGTSFEAEDVGGGTLEPSSHSLRLGLVWHFGK